MDTPASKKGHPFRQISRFVFDREHSLYRHPDNFTIEYQDGGEAYVLDCMKKVKDLSSRSPEFMQYIRDWPSRYHFSRQRVNFLEAIKSVLPKNAEVLEIGSGCGTVTRWLGEQCRTVDALEGNFQRAVITRYRTKDLDNVQVYCGDVLATGFDRKYDIITLIGSLEYIPCYDSEYNDPKEACTALLTRLKTSLKTDGILLVAIENRFGAKYFSGCREDHTGRAFEGIIGYPDKTPVTFSRNELGEILSRSGFGQNRFYHVFPDYKLTESILPENPQVLSLRPYNWIQTPFEEYSGQRLNLFPDLLFLKSITDSTLLWQFSNSFVVLASPGQTTDLTVPWLIKKYRNSESLDPKFSHELCLVSDTGSRFPNEKFVVNRSLLAPSCETDTSEKFEFRLLSNDYVAGELLVQKLYAALFQKDPEDAIRNTVIELQSHLLKTCSIDRKDQEGYPLVKGDAIDFTFWNLIIGEDHNPVFIDKKWKYRGPLPVDIILFRNLFHIFDRICPFLKNKNKQQFILATIQSIYPQYSENRLSANLEFENTFQSYASGRVRTYTLDSPVQNSLSEIVLENQELQFQVATLTRVLAAKDREISTIDELVRILTEENTSFKHSISYIILSKFRKVVIEPLFPQSSRRREMYDLALQGGRVAVNEGVGPAISKFKRYHRSRKNTSADRIRNLVKKYSYATADRIRLPETGDMTEISIIIPVCNKIRYTLNSLKSIAENTTGSYEVIIVDDASTDETPVQVKKIPNLRIIRNEENLGFVESCNIGAKNSRGKYLLFLNNDTVVTENWLTPLLNLIKNDDVGAVGSKLVYPDGVLQEAGGIIWKDASGWNYGRGDNPDKPEYNFPRDVDYCSGAALLVKKDIFERIGGFDRQFIPAYYEDTDLCFSVRKLGYRVLYQPLSVVIHFEGISNGTNVNEGVKRNQLLNREKFFRKWHDVLLHSHFEPDPRNLFVARTRSPGRHILVIDQHVPFFDRDSGSYRMFNILKILVELGHTVTFIGDNFSQFEPYDTVLEQLGIEVLHSPFINSMEKYLSQSGENFNIVILSRPDIAKKHMAQIRTWCSRAKVIYDTVDLQFLRETRMAGIRQDPRILVQAETSRRNELQLARMSDITFVVSTREQEILKKEDPSLNVQVLSNIHSVTVRTKNFYQRRDILFVGAFLHPPNPDGVLWFIRDIFPRIKQQKPDMKLFIVGDRPTSEIQSLSSEDIVVTGYVEDLSGFFNNCRVFVAPLRFGAGVKGKIHQSMSYGLPVVTTSIGAEGMGIIDGENVLIADDPELFSRKVIQIYDDENLWNTISDNSVEHIRKTTSYEQSKNRIRELIDSL